MSIRSYLNNPKMQMFFLLTLIAVTAIIHSPSYSSLLTIGLAIFSCILLDFFFRKAQKVTGVPPGAAGVTGVIIGLLTSPTLPLYIVIIASLFAMISKHFIRPLNRHIFNPAGFGLFVAHILFAEQVSWWGTSWQQLTVNNLLLTISFLILLSPLLISAHRLKRYFIQGSFLATLTIAFIFMNLFNLIFQQQPLQDTIVRLLFEIIPSVVSGLLLDPTTLFFTAVMLPEPMTTPSLLRKQLVFGATVAILALGDVVLGWFTPVLMFTSAIPDILIFSLLLSNLIFFYFRR